MRPYGATKSMIWARQFLSLIEQQTDCCSMGKMQFSRFKIRQMDSDASLQRTFILKPALSVFASRQAFF